MLFSGAGCSGSDEGVDLVRAGLRVCFAEFDESADVLGLKEHHAQKVRTLDLLRTEAAREEPEGLGELRLELVREAPQVERGPQDQQTHPSQAIPVLRVAAFFSTWFKRSIRSAS